MTLIPETVSAIKADWLSKVLSERFPGVAVADIEIAHSREGTNQHGYIRVNYQNPAGGPEQLFCKMLPSDSARKKLIANTHMGLREALFYKSVAPYLNMRTPEIYYADCNEQDDSFILLMEDIEASGCTVSDGTQTVAIDSAAQALEDLANIHLQFESPQIRRARIPWLTKTVFSNDDGANYGPKMLQYGLDHHRDKLAPDFISLSEIYITRHVELHELWARGPQTLIHGDLHIGNLFDDQGRTGFLDWGIISIGTPLRDLSYFLTLSLSTEDRREHQQALIKHYLAVRNASASTSISFDEAWRAHQLHAAYTVPACCHIVTFPSDASFKRRRFADAFLGRAQAAIEDLDVVDALQNHYGITM